MFFVKTLSTLTVILDGTPYNIPTTHPEYARLEKAVAEKDVETAREIVTARQALNQLEALVGDIEVCGGQVRHQGRQIHNYLVDLILAVPENPTPMIAFLDNVMKNPSNRAVTDLYRWCEHANLPITPDGHILAYKIVRHDYRDIHSGTFDNSVGQIVQVPRNEVDDDPSNTCSRGLHFCSAEYLPAYGPSNGRVMLVKVNPADVVAFPTDYRFSKARCCRYEVIKELDKETAASFFPEDTHIWEDEPELTIEDRVEKIISTLNITILTPYASAQELIGAIELVLFGQQKPFVALEERLVLIENLIAQAKAG